MFFLFLVVEYQLKTTSMFKSAEKLPASLATNVSQGVGSSLPQAKCSWRHTVFFWHQTVFHQENYSITCSCYFGGWKSKMLNDPGDSIGSNSFESLINFSLIWYTVWRCTTISCDNLAMQWSGHIWAKKRVIRRRKKCFFRNFQHF